MNTRLLRLFSVVAVAATCIISCGKQEKPDDHSTPDSGSGDKKVTGVTLDKTSVTLSKGQEIQLKATVKPDDAENKTVLWTSSNKSVATVKDGLVTAVGDGTSVIKVTTVDGLLTATCDVEVSTIYVKKITIPENLDYSELFDDLMEKYTTSSELMRVRTANMGTLYELQYEVSLKDEKASKAFIDDIRCRNGNLNIALGRIAENDSL